jgi:hypothetical protein
MQRRGTLSTTLDLDTFTGCRIHLDALGRLRGHTLATHRGELVAWLSLLLSHLARAVAPITAAGGPHRNRAPGRWRGHPPAGT